MLTRALSLILPLLALPALAACSGNDDPALPPPASQASLASIASDPGISRERLGQAMDQLFVDEEVGKTNALLILRGGKVIAERYADGFDAGTRLLGWSASQCVTGVAIGLLVSDGRLRLDETAPVPTWQRSSDPRGEITLRQLLQMRSGLRHADQSESEDASDQFSMLFLSGRDDMADFIEAQPLVGAPGRRFTYSPANAAILSDMATRALTDSAAPTVRREIMAEYLRSRLFEPVGMTSMVPEFDAAGTMIGSAMIHATPRDWAKLGEFVRNRGSVKGAQIVPRRWIEFMQRPSPRNPGYGALLWLNRPQPDGNERLFPGQAASNVHACIGEHGQYVIGSPDQKLTVVRMGLTRKKQLEALRQRLGDIVALFPAA